MRKSLIFIAFLCISFHMLAQARNNRLDKILRTYEKQNQLHGFVCIDSMGENIYSKSVGYSNIEERIPGDSNTLYGVGSITKTYVAILIMMKVEQAKVTLKSSIEKWFPEMPHAKKITIESLLLHRSGITDQNYFNWKYRGKKFKLINKPKYSNVNYGLLGLILEQIENRKLNQILQEELCIPFGLSNTFYDLADSNRHKMASPYWFDKKNRWHKSEPVVFAEAGGAGAILSTAPDLNRFLFLLYTGKIISKESIEQMTSFETGMGMGVFPSQYYQLRGFSNSGQIGPYRSTFVCFPEEGITVSVLTNASSVSLNPLLKEIMDEIIQ